MRNSQQHFFSVSLSPAIDELDIHDKLKDGGGNKRAAVINNLNLKFRDRGAEAEELNKSEKKETKCIIKLDTFYHKISPMGTLVFQKKVFPIFFFFI